MPSSSSLLAVSDEERNKMYEILGITEERLKKALEDLQAWYKLQPHFPKEMPENTRFKLLLIANRMSVEKVKTKIDYQLMIRNFMPEFFDFKRLLENNLQNIFDNIEWVPLPKLSSDLSRVTIMRIVGEPEHFSLETLINFQYLVGEYRITCDCALKDRYVLDFQNFKMGHIMRLNLVALRKSDTALKKAYGMHLAGIHILNAPPFIDRVLSIFKQTLKPKLAARITVHDSYEELFNSIDRSVIPCDYGGGEKPTSEIVDDWKKELLTESWKQEVLKVSNMMSDESKRMDKSIQEDLFGICGSFRKLDVD